MPSIGIIGYGYVGSAIGHGFKHFGYKDIKIFDPNVQPESKINDVIDCDIIFICVPTPMGEGGHIDDSIVEETINELEARNCEALIVIKSTLLPTSVKKFKDKFVKSKIATNPEFLTERRAKEDFINSKWIILGGKTSELAQLYSMYSKMFPTADISLLSAESAMMMKYMTNTLFASKISLMNEYRELWDKLLKSEQVSGSWDELVEAFSTDHRVGTEHLDVPGPDGDRGWGGRCFPKDLNALMSLCKEYNTSCKVMNAAWKDNLNYRTNKDWLIIDGATTPNYVEEDNIDGIIWFVDVSGMPEYVVSAKMNQMKDSISKNKPFGGANILIVPCNENKIALLKTNKEFFDNLHGDSLECLNEIKEKAEDCLMMTLFEKRE